MWVFPFSSRQLIFDEHIDVPTLLGYVDQRLLVNSLEIQIGQRVADLHVVELHVVQPRRQTGLVDYQSVVQGVGIYAQAGD